MSPSIRTPAQTATPTRAPGQLVVEREVSRRPAPRPTTWHGLFAGMLRAWQAVRLRQPHTAAGEAVAEFVCSHCGGTSARMMETVGVPRGRDFDPVQCTSCELVAIHPMPSAEQVPDFYEVEYYGEQNAKFGRLTEWCVDKFRRARVAALRRAGVRSGRVLDVGCARGLFLSQLRRRGYDVYGTELSDVSAQGARARLGVDRVRVGTLEECRFAAGTFDAITAWQVFEHLLDPGATLDECHRLLQADGKLILAVPNIDSWQARWSDTEWFHLDVPRHIFHYSPATLGRLLRAHGFEVERVVHQNLEQNPFGLLQSALHRIGRPYYGLYDMLKQQRGRRLFAFACYLLAFPFAAAISALTAARGSGATFTIHARRVS